MINQIITSTVLMMTILLLSLLLEKRISPCIRYALWLLVAVKLLIPLPAFETRMSILNVVEQAGQNRMQYLFVDNEANALEENGNLTDMVPDMHPGAESVEHRQENSAQANRLSFAGIAGICIYIWIGGMVLCGGIFLWSNLRFHKYLRKERIFVGNYKGKLPIFEVAGIGPPCLFGIFAPAIYLNKDSSFSKEQRAYILEHEYTHFRHGDCIWAVVRCICVIGYWYHPLVWLAAYRSAGDGELACDAGTLKRIGEENYVQYGRTLIAAAHDQSKRREAHLLGCGAGVTGGMREMKKRIFLLKNRPHTRLAAVAGVAVLCCGIVGCTFGGAADRYGAAQVLPKPPKSIAAPEKDIVFNTNLQQIESAGAAEQTESLVYQEVTLYREPMPDKVCIIVHPSELREYMEYYYIPTGEAQDILKSFMDGLEGAWQKDAWRKEENVQKMETAGCWLWYQEKRYTVFDNGYLYASCYDYEDDKLKELLVQEKEICDFVKRLLSENLGYEKIDITQIHDIISARLDVCSIATNWEFYSQTITDKETLELWEGWFRNAKYIGDAGCGNEDACLELKLSDGETIKLSMATDSCPNFGVNGVYYDYRPKAAWGNSAFYRYFDEIPWEFQ